MRHLSSSILALCLCACTHRVSPRKIYFELEQLSQPTYESKTIGSVKVELPEGARFPVVYGKLGERWSLSDSERADSKLELALLRISPDLSRVAYVVSAPNRLPTLHEVELASKKETIAPLAAIYDAVYLPDGRLLASMLFNAQPRKVVIVDPKSQEPVRTILDVPKDRFVILSIEAPTRIKISGWDGLVTEFRLPYADQQVETANVLKEVNYGCATIAQSLNRDSAHCNLMDVTSADGTQIPISVISRANQTSKSPVYIRSYGAYGESLRPELTLRERYLVRHGLTIVLAHIRGGGEKEGWHAAARGGNRKKSLEDLNAVLEMFRDRSIAIASSSAGAMVALSAAARHNGGNLSVILDSPLLDLTDNLARFPEDFAEFGETPLEMLPFTVAPQLSQGTRVLIICSIDDPLIPAKSCQDFKDRASNSSIDLWFEGEQRHNEPWSRTSSLELDSRVLTWLSNSNFKQF